MNRNLIIGAVAVVILLAGGGALYARSHHAKPVVAVIPKPAPQPTPEPATAGTPDQPPAPTPATSGSTSVTTKSTTTINGQTTVTPVNIDVNAADSGNNQTFNVSAGAQVTITFHVASDVYDGGLVFDGSNGKNTGTIAAGRAGSLSFLASGSVTFKPYWPNGTPKNYVIQINAS